MAGKSKKGKLKFVGKLILVINWVFVLCLLISNYAHLFNPENYLIFAFIGLAFPYFIVINLFFVIYWSLRRRLNLFYSLVALAVSWNMITRFVVFHSSGDSALTSRSFKVLTYNVRVFDIYNYNKRWVSNTKKRNGIFNFIKEEAPDIMCFQEFVDDKSGKFRTLDTIPLFQKAKNVHFEYTLNSRKMNYFGIATFTSFPIVNKGKILFGKRMNNLCIYTDIFVDNKIIRIYNIHLQSIKFVDDDYEFAERIRNLDNIDKDNKFKTESKQIFKRLRKAFMRRAPQADLVAEHIKTCPYPFILCGDFNDTPSSYAYYKLSNNTDDAFCLSGNGFSQTYSGSIFPSFRIDYILHSKSLKSFDYQKGDILFSDHYPLLCKFRY